MLNLLCLINVHTVYSSRHPYWYYTGIGIILYWYYTAKYCIDLPFVKHALEIHLECALEVTVPSESIHTPCFFQILLLQLEFKID